MNENELNNDSMENYERLKNYVFSIAFSNYFSDKLNHGLEVDDGWKIFEPSQFVYAYFSFNALYNIDWEKSVSATKLKKLRLDEEKQKISALLDFLYAYPSNYTFKEFYKIYDDKLRIIDSSRRTRNINGDNLNKYKSACEKLRTNDFSREDHENLLFFCYKIRNNIFHGHKSPEAMLKISQIERITTYKNILSATIDMFMKIINTKMQGFSNLDEELLYEKNELLNKLKTRSKKYEQVFKK